MEKEKKDVNVYIDANGVRVSEVISLSSRVEVESVLCGRQEPKQLRLYFDADHKDPYGPNRPQLVVNMTPKGNVASIALYCKGKEKMYWENK